MALPALKAIYWDHFIPRLLPEQKDDAGTINDFVLRALVLSSYADRICVLL